MAESSGRAENESLPFVLDEALQEMIQDDQEEWEYEYSTTETEVSVDKLATTTCTR